MPHPNRCSRHELLPRPDWWRCRVSIGADADLSGIGHETAAAYGTVTGAITLGGTVQHLQVQLDDGTGVYLTPDRVDRITGYRRGDRLYVYDGGRPCA